MASAGGNGPPYATNSPSIPGLDRRGGSMGPCGHIDALTAASDGLLVALDRQHGSNDGGASRSSRSGTEPCYRLTAAVPPKMIRNRCHMYERRFRIVLSGTEVDRVVSGVHQVSFCRRCSRRWRWMWPKYPQPCYWDRGCGARPSGNNI